MNTQLNGSSFRSSAHRVVGFCVGNQILQTQYPNWICCFRTLQHLLNRASILNINSSLVFGHKSLSIFVHCAPNLLSVRDPTSAVFISFEEAKTCLRFTKTHKSKTICSLKQRPLSCTKEVFVLRLCAPCRNLPLHGRYRFHIVLTTLRATYSTLSIPTTKAPHGAFLGHNSLRSFVPRVGIEPTTVCLKGNCSTD